jgi:hypothetical protein
VVAKLFGVSLGRLVTLSAARILGLQRIAQNVASTTQAASRKMVAQVFMSAERPDSESGLYRGLAVCKPIICEAVFIRVE